MSLRMTVSRTDVIPGSTSTVVVFSEPGPDADFKTKEVIATLRGISKTRISTREGANEEIHEDIATFLEIPKKIDCRAYLLEDGHVSTFHFELPNDPVRLQHEPDYMYWWRDSNTPKPQTLPPSGKFGPGNEIVYSFDVYLFDEISDSEITARTEVTFTPTREPEASDPKSLTIIKKIELPINPNSSSKQTTLQLALSSPQTLIQGQPFDLKLRLVQAATISTLFPPIILLKSILVHLLVNTSIKSKENTKEDFSYKQIITSFSSIDSNDKLPSITPQGLDLTKLCHEFKIPPNFAVSFATPNIQRKYGLEIMLVVECGENTFDIVFELDDVVLLGAELGGEGRKRQQDEDYDPYVDGIVRFDDDGNPHKGYPDYDDESGENE